MNIPKACGPQVLYRCKYCQKCIKGIEAFINHKRENHNDLLEFNKNEDLKYEPEKKHEVVERQPAYRYRPGPKSRKPQLLINSPLESTASSSKSAPDTILEPDSTTDALIPKTEEDFLSSSSIRNSVKRKSTGEESDKDSGNDMSTAETVSCSSGNGSLTDSLIAPVSANTIEGVDDDIMIISGNTQPQYPQNGSMSHISAERNAYGEEEDDDIQIIAVLPPAENTSKHAAFPSNTVPLTHVNHISENNQRLSVLPTHTRSSGNPIALSHFVRERERSVIQEVVPKGSSTRLVNGLHNLSSQLPGTGIIAKGWDEKNDEYSDRGAVIRSGSGKAVSLIQSDTGENHTSLPSNSIVPKPVIYENSHQNNYGLHQHFENGSDTLGTPDLHNHSLTSTVVPDVYAEEADSPDESDFIPQIMSVYSEALPNHSSNTSSNASSPSLPRRINILPVDKARYRFKCWSCDKVFSKKKDRSAHAKVSHGSTVPFKCSICAESFAQERSLMRHKVMHLQYPCPVCNRKCDGKVDFDAHMKSHEKKVRKVIQPQTEAPCETETPAPASDAIQQHTNQERVPIVTIKEACHLIKQAQPREDGRYPCVICSTHLKNKPSLRLHFRIHTGEKPYKCRHCSQTFIQFNHRMRHELKFHSNAQLRPLGTNFSRTVRPTQHVKVSQNPIPKLKTPSVTAIPAAPISSGDIPSSVKMSLQDALAFLRLARLGPNQRFQCPLCSAQPKSKVTLKLHLRLHTGEKPHKCGVCNLTFRQHSQRKKHEIRIHGGTLTQCNFCPERFRDPMKLKIHQACHRGPKLMRCRFCPELFDGIKSRRDHESQHTQRSKQISDPVHVQQTSTKTIGTTPNPARKFTVIPNGGRRYFCPQCPKVYQYPHQLRAHMGTHGDAWKTFKCSYCSQKFSRSEACSYHENSHTGSRPFKCPNCPKAYPHPMSLTYHKNTAHKGEEFLESKSPEPPAPSRLQLPVATERNISPRKGEDHVIEYPCSFCEKTFRNYTHQKEHERTHTGEKPYQCQFCDKSFAQSSPWKYHQNTHTGARPFECATCKQTFATPADRTQHERNTHGYVPGSPRTATTTLPAPRSNLAKSFTDIDVANPRINEANLATTQLRNQGNQSVSNFSKRSETVTKQAKDSYNCRFCRRSFDDATTLRFHEMTHPQSRSVLVSTPSIKSINATVSSSSNAGQVKAHQRSPPVQVPPLPASSSTNPAKTNVEGPPFICSTCGKSFHGPKHLEYHENIHTGARPFECRFCPRAFAHPANLRKHEGVMHGAESEPTAVSRPVFHESREQASPVLLITNTEATESGVEMETEEAESFNPERPHSCQFCPKAFPSLCTLKYHENTHTGARPYKCGYCPKGFAHPNNRRVHIASMHRNEVEDEQVVGLGLSAHLEEPNHTMSHFLSSDVLQLQVIQDEEQDVSDQTEKRVLRIPKSGSEVPLGEGPYPCQHCGRRFTQKNSRNYHLNLHTGALPFKCSLCNMAFYHPSMRSKHMVAAHNSESLPTPTPTTSQSESGDLSAANPGISSTRAAQLINTGQNNSRPVTSTGVQNVTVTPIPIAKVPTVPAIRALKSVKRKRKGKPQHRYIKVKCHLCDKSFRKDYLPIHIRYHTDERIFHCEDCDQSFHHIQALKDHTRRKHSDERPYGCEVCGKSFAVPVDLHLHRKTHQQRQRKYGCNMCGKKYLTSADLKGHKLIHARPFPCSHCDKTFELQLHMEDHVRVAHTREQPFQCLRCLQRFSSQITYIKHMDRQSCVPKVATGDQNQGESSGRRQLSDFAGSDESPQFSYNCSLCNCSFSQKELAAAHARWHQEQLQN